MQVKYTIKKSEIPGAGLGLFADEDIPKGTKVWEFKHKNHEIWLTKEALEKHLSKLSKDGAKHYLAHCYDFNEKVVVYELEDGKFMNHSFSPNVIDIPNSNDDYAARDIKKGEEMLENYASHDVNFNSFRVDLEKKYGVWQAEKANKVIDESELLF